MKLQVTAQTNRFASEAVHETRPALSAGSLPVTD